ncbi:hypothetical protein CR513_59831, partial [Mucuna pruriens]
MLATTPLFLISFLKEIQIGNFDFSLTASWPRKMDVESKRETMSIKVKAPDSLVLKRYAEMLKGSTRRIFGVRYGKILDLVEIEVQSEVLSVIAQFYDPSVRSFLFKDFQLAPTLEEYEHILGRPLIDGSPYLYQCNLPSWGRITKLLRVLEMELIKRKQQRSGIEGIPLSYLEEKMHFLLEIREWDNLIDVLGLAMYGIILLPHLNDYIDLEAINAFLATWERGSSSVVVVLENTYYSLQRCHDGRGRRLTCCMPALYL